MTSQNIEVASPTRTTSSSGIPAVVLPVDPAEGETQKRLRSKVSAFDDLVTANMALVEMGNRLIRAVYVVLGIVLLESGIALYAAVHR